MNSLRCAANRCSCLRGQDALFRRNHQLTTRGHEKAIDLNVCDDACYGICRLSAVARISRQGEVHFNHKTNSQMTEQQ